MTQLRLPLVVQIKLKYGVNALPIEGATAHLWRDELHLDHVMIVVDGCDRGCFSGMREQCDVWFDGYLQAWFSAAQWRAAERENERFERMERDE